MNSRMEPLTASPAAGPGDAYKQKNPEEWAKVPTLSLVFRSLQFECFVQRLVRRYGRVHVFLASLLSPSLMVTNPIPRWTEHNDFTVWIS